MLLEEIEKVMDGEIVYYYETTAEERANLNNLHNMALAYCVLRSDKADEGLVVFAKYSEAKGFEANPWSCRSLIRKLLEEKGISFKQPSGP